MTEAVMFPGYKIASIEEYEAGYNAFDDGDMVRAAVIGDLDIDKSTRTANITHSKVLSVPKVGDIVTGTVVAVMSSLIIISIDYINDKPTTSKVECVCSTRNLRRKNAALVKDIVRLKILNHLNGAIHSTIEGSQLGVLFTKCRKCGSKVIQIRDAIKCVDCGWIDDRKLSNMFGKSDFIKLRRNDQGIIPG